MQWVKSFCCWGKKRKAAYTAFLENYCTFNAIYSLSKERDIGFFTLC